MDTLSSKENAEISIIEFIDILRVVIDDELDGIKRVKASVKEIVQDVIHPDTIGKIERGVMPHYANCLSISDLILKLLERRWINASLAVFHTAQWQAHVWVHVIIDWVEFFIAWHKETIYLTHEGAVRDMFKATNRHGDTLEEYTLLEDTKSYENALNNHAQYLQERANYIVTESTKPENDIYLNQRLRLEVMLPEVMDAMLLDSMGISSIASHKPATLHSIAHVSEDGHDLFDSLKKSLQHNPPVLIWKKADPETLKKLQKSWLFR